MPKQVTKTVYTFAELLERSDERASQRARDWLIEGVNDHDWWDNTRTTWRLALLQIGFLEIDISFRGFGSQGDGASFTAQVDVATLLNFLTTEIEPTEVISFDGQREDFRGWLIHEIGRVRDPDLAPLKAHAKDLLARVTRDQYGGNYVHANTCSFSVAEDGNVELSCPSELVDRFERAGEALRSKLSNAIYRDLEEDYNYQTSDEALAESAEANDWYFTAEGRHERV